MPKYTQRVIETRAYTVRYTVQARNRAEAANKIAIGDTIEEEEEKNEGVHDRAPWGNLDLVKEPKAPKIPKAKILSSRWAMSKLRS